MELNIAKIHIIGGTGQMGNWLHKFLESQGITSTVSDEKKPQPELLSKADIIFISTPIDVTPEVIKDTAKFVKKDALLIDLSSVKSETVQALKELKNPATSFHFLFGPNVTTVMHQKIVHIKIRENENSKKIAKLFEKAGAQVITMTSDEHDKQMAYVQALTHFINLSFSKILIDNKIGLALNLSTPVFLSQLTVLEKVINQNPDMIGSIQVANPNFKLVLNQLIKDQTELLSLIEKKESKKLSKIYAGIKKSLDLPKVQKPTKVPEKAIETALSTKKVKVGYLGPEGTFSHEATEQIIKNKESLIKCETIYDIFDSVSKGNLDFGVVPAENSIEGTIRETLDFLVKFDLKVNLQIELSVHQNLLAKQSDIHKIKKVISHPQGLAQCRTWLEEHLPGVKLETSSSTISAVNNGLDDETAIIGSSLAAKIYDLKILAPDIEDKQQNITKFYLISKKLQTLSKKPTKTLLFLTIFNRVGILKDILSVLADFDINLNKLESRPSLEKNWDYYFYVEVESSASELRLKQALKGLKQFCPVTIILGEY